MPLHRKLLIIRGSELETREHVERLIASLPERSVAWIAEVAPAPAHVHVRPHELAARLGQAFDVVVLDAHARLDADALGQAHGLVFGGGALVLRLGLDLVRDPRMAVHPYSVADVGLLFEAHVERVLSRHASPIPDALSPVDRQTTGTREQAELVDQLIHAWTGATPSRTAILADRGRGKSSALGLALRGLAEQTKRESIITAGSEAAVAEVLRFAGDASRFVPLLDVRSEPAQPGAVIVVDEAAQLPVPLLQRLVLAHPLAHLAFATTAHGYEGTGRGFSLRFSKWLEQRGPLARLRLHEPIRWSVGDPLERAVFEALLLDAEPAELATDLDPSAATLEILDRKQLAHDLPRLRELFGLLVHAHYRTTPGDLQRLLDAPNLQIHAALLHGHVVGACVIAQEGELPPALIEAARSGRTRLRAHALADVLVAHLGRAEAGALRMRRSVRLAVHPALRRHGLATRLIEHTHAHHEVDLFGTLFGATPELLELRRRLGYQLVRVSASRGARTGEPSVMMIKPVSASAHRLVAELRFELARELDAQLALLQADEGHTLDPLLLTAMRAELPDIAPYSASECRALALAYAHGPRTFESLATALRGFLDSIDLDPLPADLRAIVEARALQRHGWHRITRDLKMPSIAATMRAMRRAIRLLVDEAGEMAHVKRGSIAE
ncbi:MAG TPA: GNAT family N-acetyltransferase [Enhygromyxa sp.]|nr:GNAT family N-acetyltransferase [Enhygromyxa sp.]